MCHGWKQPLKVARALNSAYTCFHVLLIPNWTWMHVYRMYMTLNAQSGASHFRSLHYLEAQTHSPCSVSNRTQHTCLAQPTAAWISLYLGFSFYWEIVFSPAFCFLGGIWQKEASSFPTVLPTVLVLLKEPSFLACTHPLPSKPPPVSARLWPATLRHCPTPLPWAIWPGSLLMEHKILS